MYEIWLVLNILWEIALSVWPMLALAGLAWIALAGYALSRPSARWRAGLAPAALAGVAVAAAAFLLVPGATRSSLSELAYWVDWANLLGIALGFGAAAAAFAWPLLALRGRAPA